MMLLILEKEFHLLNMVKSISLVNGIGSLEATKKYYDDWSEKYDKTLNEWNYKVPKKCINLLKRNIKHKPNSVLDLACGTGLFGEELFKTYGNIKIFGSDISQKSLISRKMSHSLKRSNFSKKKKVLFFKK